VNKNEVLSQLNQSLAMELARHRLEEPQFIRSNQSYSIKKSFVACPLVSANQTGR